MIAAREARRRSWRRATGSGSEPQPFSPGLSAFERKRCLAGSPSFQWVCASRWPEWFGAAQLALLNLAQIEDIARERLPPSLALWITYGVEDEESLVRSKRFHRPLSITEYMDQVFLICRLAFETISTSCLLDCFHRC